EKDVGESRLSLLMAIAEPPSAEVTLAEAGQVSPSPTSIVVSIDEVRARSATSGWVTLDDQPFSFDLLSPSGFSAALGPVTLASGDVVEVRLLTGDGSYVAMADGSTHPLTVSSGAESGIKIVGPWPLHACEELELRLDGDPIDSVRVHTTSHV